MCGTRAQVHWWIQRALQSHPWVVATRLPDETSQRGAADAIYFNASFTYGHRYPRAAVASAASQLADLASELATGLATGPNHSAGGGGCRALVFATSFSTRHGLHRKVRSPCLVWLRELDAGLGDGRGRPQGRTWCTPTPCAP